jgi:hypothetical protein
MAVKDSRFAEWNFMADLASGEIFYSFSGNFNLQLDSKSNAGIKQ